MASQITGVSIVCSTVCLFRWIHTHTQRASNVEMFSFDDVIMQRA